MLLLTSTSDKLQVVSSAAVTTDVQASWVDYASGTITPGRTNTAITTATTTDVVAAPASSTQRNVKHLSVRNKHASTAQDITVKHTDGTTAVELFKCTLAAGEELVFSDGTGFMVFDATGALKTRPTGTGANTDITSLKGTITNDDAAAGKIGEYISSTIATPGTSLTSLGQVALTSISLTAGDWDVSGYVGIYPAASTSISRFRGQISASSSGFPDDCVDFIVAAFVPGNNTMAFALPTQRFSLAATTTVYLVIDAVFTVSTCAGFGRISARRIR